jgi:chitin-binding protein
MAVPDAAAGAPVAPGGGNVGQPSAPAGCTLAWSPSATRDGETAFEFLEMPDRNMVHPGVPHLSVVADHDAYRFDSHYDPPGMVDFDRAVFTGPIRNDRLRGEVRGMVGPSGQLDLLNGQTWRISWSLFIPSSLKGTSRFTHIMQMKFVDTKGGVSGSPVVTLTLRPQDRIELLLWLGGGSVATADLSALHDRWLTSDLTIKIAPSGSVHWVFSDGSKTIVDKQQNGVTWPAEAARLRPKWGIYRGIAEGVQTSYMLISDYRAYLCQPQTAQ